MQFKFFGLLASLAMLVGCAINHSGSLPVEFQPALEPSRFFEQALEATVGVDRSSVAINFADEAIGRMKDTAKMSSRR